MVKFLLENDYDIRALNAVVTDLVKGALGSLLEDDFVVFEFRTDWLDSILAEYADTKLDLVFVEMAVFKDKSVPHCVGCSGYDVLDEARRAHEEGKMVVFVSTKGRRKTDERR